MLSFIFSVLKPCFKSLNNTKLNSLSKAIACVALGLRVCHLVDIAHLDLEKAKSLLLKLRKNPECKSLVLVQFKDRFTFICNKNKLKQHVNDTLSSPTSSFVYISVNEDQPVKLNVPPTQLIFWLQYKLLPLISTKETYFYSSILPTCMVSITGWILEYPIIYTTHVLSDEPTDELDEWEQRTNCLGNQVLQLVEYWLPLTDHMLLSYSCPSNSMTTNEDRLMQGLKLKINQRIGELNPTPDWLKNTNCEIRKEQIKLDRFAL